MIPRRMNRAVAMLVLAASVTVPVILGSGASESTEFLYPSKGGNVFHVSFSGSEAVRRFDLLISFDGKTYHETSSGLHRPHQLFWSTRSSNGRTILFVPVFAGFDSRRFIFTDPGPLWIRWIVETNGTGGGRLEIDQTAEIGPAAEADERFLSRIGDPDLLRRLFGDDYFERKTDAVRQKMLSPAGADGRALSVVSKLLLFTRSREPGDVVGPKGTYERAMVWAGELSALAKEFPDSSYAPYAAHYAGCCYIFSVMKDNKEHTGELAAKAGRNHPHFAAADELLRFAAERADGYLKPRTLYMRAILSGMVAEWDDLSQRVDQLISTEAPAGQFRRQVDKLRADAQRKRDKRAQK